MVRFLGNWEVNVDILEVLFSCGYDVFFFLLFRYFLRCRWRFGVVRVDTRSIRLFCGSWDFGIVWRWALFIIVSVVVA